LPGGAAKQPLDRPFLSTYIRRMAQDKPDSSSKYIVARSAARHARFAAFVLFRPGFSLVVRAADFKDAFSCASSVRSALAQFVRCS